MPQYITIVYVYILCQNQCIWRKNLDSFSSLAIPAISFSLPSWTEPEPISKVEQNKAQSQLSALLRFLIIFHYSVFWGVSNSQFLAQTWSWSKVSRPPGGACAQGSPASPPPRPGRRPPRSSTTAARSVCAENPGLHGCLSVQHWKFKPISDD